MMLESQDLPTSVRAPSAPNRSPAPYPLVTTTPSTSPDGSAPGYDVIIVADMTRPGDIGYRIAEDVRHYAGRGLRVGLLQGGPPRPRSRIFPEIQACVRRGLAQVVPPGSNPPTALLVAHAPSRIDWGADRFARLESRRTVLVCHGAADFDARIAGGLTKGATVFAPVNAAVRHMAPPIAQLTEEDWRPVCPRASPRLASASRVHGTRRRQAIGWVRSGHSGLEPPAVPDDIDLFVLQLDGGDDVEAGHARLAGHGCPSLDRLLALDALAYFPEPGDDLPETILSAALAAGRLVVLPPSLKPVLGEGPLYVDPSDAADAIIRVLGDRGERAAYSAAARRASRDRSPKQLPAPMLKKERAAGAPVATPRRPVMFLPSNGVGVGHVSRLLAIARRLDPETPVLFVSQAQAIQAIERFGYLAEYIPSATYVGGRFETWDQWFRYELEKLIDAYDPAVVVYDGNNPSDGLIEAVASRRDCKLAWVRRGLWGRWPSPFMANARWCDLIIEPGELEEQVDEGASAPRRAEVAMVPPITLLDADDLLPRVEAAKALGIDPARPSVLIHLGAGYNRDVVSQINEIVEILQQTPRLQVCIAEWVNSSHELNYWKDVVYLKGFPLSQYFNAFDFSIAAAGYNSFHEVIKFGLPTIFIPNRHPSMDNQGARAELAQDLQAAFVLDEEDFDDLSELVRILLDSNARGFIEEKSMALGRPNGAAEAARLLTQLAGGAA